MLLLPLMAGFAYAKAPMQDGYHIAELDLVSLMQKSPSNKDGLFEHGLELVHNLQNAPSCHRLATASLLDSCKSIEALDDSQSKTNHLALEQVKSTFAARLAICEIEGAHVDVPEQCSPLSPRPYPSKTGSLRCRLPGRHCQSRQNPDAEWSFDKADGSALKDCLQTLESRPQWWISYSNARQNAVILCHATRHELERDKVIATFESLFEASGDASESLLQASQASQSNMSQQKRFAEEVGRLQSSLLEELKSGRGFLKEVFRDMASTAGSQMQHLLDLMTTKSFQAHEEFEELHENLEKSKTTVKTYTKGLQHDMEQLSHLANRGEQQLEINLDKSQQLANSLDEVGDNKLRQIQETAMQTQECMTALVEVVLQFHSRLVSNERGMTVLSRTIQALETQSQNLEQGYLRQSNTMESFWQKQQEVTQTYIASLMDAQSSVERLTAAVDNQTARIPFLTGNGVGGWIWSSVFVLPWIAERLLGWSGAGLTIAMLASCLAFYQLLFRLLASGSLVAVWSYTWHVCVIGTRLAERTIAQIPTISFLIAASVSIMVLSGLKIWMRRQKSSCTTLAV